MAGQERIFQQHQPIIMITLQHGYKGIRPSCYKLIPRGKTSQSAGAALANFLKFVTYIVFFRTLLPRKTNGRERGYTHTDLAGHFFPWTDGRASLHTYTHIRTYTHGLIT